MSSRLSFALLCGSLAFGCGARTGIVEIHRDAGPSSIDAATFDAPRFDTGRDAPLGDMGTTLVVMCSGAVSVIAGDVVPLSVTATSNADGPVTFAWGVASAPAGATGAPTPVSGSVASITVDVAGDWLVRMSAVDGAGNTADCTVAIHADPDITLLCPNDQSNFDGATLALNAVVASRRGLTAMLDWSVTSAPAGSTSTPNVTSSTSTSFVLDQNGDWSIHVVAHDSAGGRAECDTHLHADPDVRVTCPPNASSGPFATTTLTATANSLVGRPLTFAWEIVSAPITSTAHLASPTSLSTAFTFDVAGDWTYRFTATSSTGNHASCTTRALAHSDEAVRVELVWNLDRSCRTCNPQGGGIDLDLHLADVSRAMGHWNGAAPNQSDCYWENCHCGMPGMVCTPAALDWPPSGDLDDPQLDIDHNTDLPGPENINVLRAQLGEQLDVGVHFYGDNTSDVGHQSTEAIVRVYCAGAVAFESEPVRIGPAFTGSIAGPSPEGNPLWNVGRITITPSGCTFVRCGAAGAVGDCIRAANAW